MKISSHLGVYGVIVFQGKIVLIQKCRGPYTGQWDLPGGKIEFGESPLEALTREVEEETGLHLAEATLAEAASVRFSYRENSGEQVDLHHLGVIYECRVENPDALRLSGDGQDAGEARWFSLEEAGTLALTPFAGKKLKGKRPGWVG